MPISTRKRIDLRAFTLFLHAESMSVGSANVLGKYPDLLYAPSKSRATWKSTPFPDAK